MIEKLYKNEIETAGIMTERSVGSALKIEWYIILKKAKWTKKLKLQSVLFFFGMELKIEITKKSVFF